MPSDDGSVMERAATNRTKWAARLSLLAFLSFFAVGYGAGSAYAGVAYSSYGYSTVAGKQYQNRAVIGTSSGNAQATTETKRSSGSTPIGWAGSRGRLFTSGGSLSCEGTNQYNSTGSGALGLSCIRYSVGTWYSYGVSLAWNGSSYQSFYTFLSPNQNS